LAISPDWGKFWVAPHGTVDEIQNAAPSVCSQMDI